MVKKPQWRRFDVSKVTGPYQVLAVLLLAAEALLTTWLVKAGGALERCFAGVVMGGVFIFFMIVVNRLSKQTLRQKPRRIATPALPYTLAPAKEEVTTAQMHMLGRELIAGPDGSYTVLAPPEGWSTKQWSLSELIFETMMIKDPAIRQSLEQQLPESDRILTLDSGKEFSVVPIPGRSKVGGRKLPTALEVVIRIRLTIIPMRRFQPPLYAERPLEQNALGLLSPYFLTAFTIRNISKGIIPGSHKRYILFEGIQDIEHVIVNGSEVESLQNNCLVIAIEGDVQDFLLFMTYPSATKGALPETGEDIRMLTKLVDSFRPLKIPNPQELRAHFAEEGEKAFSHLLSEKGKELFMSEFLVLLARLAGLDLNIPEHRLRAINSLRPFKTLATELKLEFKGLKKMWDALHEAELGNAEKLKKVITELVEIFRDEEDKGEG